MEKTTLCLPVLHKTYLPNAQSKLDIKTSCLRKKKKGFKQNFQNWRKILGVERYLHSGQSFKVIYDIALCKYII